MRAAHCRGQMWTFFLVLSAYSSHRLKSFSADPKHKKYVSVQCDSMDQLMPSTLNWAKGDLHYHMHAMASIITGVLIRVREGVN